MFLMPSRFEPCGLNQLYSMRYATVPVAAATGGLVDTVRDLDDDPQCATGILFKPDDAREAVGALRRALEIFTENPELWRRLMVNGMKDDWSWDRSAGEYLEFFREKSPRPDQGRKAR